MQLLPRGDQGKGIHSTLSIKDLTRSYLQLIERTWNQEGTAYIAQREEIIAQTVFVSLPSLSKSALFRSRIEMEI